VDRTELVLLELHRLMRSGDIPAVPVFVDSPMALAALDVYRRALASNSDQFLPGVLNKADIFDPGDLRATHTAEESQRLNRPAFPSIIISASGMASGGRVVHHLAHQLPDHRNTVVLTGFQAEGTRGRRLLNGAREVKIHGRYVPVKADIVTIPDFSVHSDVDETIAWLSRAPEPPRTVYVVHGEQRAAARLADRIHADLGWSAIVPAYGERVLLD
jgi:metallo-beta-lactamase family protein